MALPTREEMLAKVDVRFRELAPSAPVHLDPNDPSHEAMIQQWHQAHHEVLSKLTDEAFFSVYPNAPIQLDPGNPEHATFIEYWKDMSNQINGEQGRYDWSNAEPAADLGEEEIEMPAQDGSVHLQDRIDYVMQMMRNFAEAVGATPLGVKVVTHTVAQIDTLRGLVRDGTFQSYDHWWRSASYSEVLYDEEDRNKEHAFVRDITLEARIDRADGVLDLQLTGWATDFRTGNSWGRVSMAGG